MRWENLTVEHEQARSLPGFREPAVVRTFDAPEALGTRFYEVRARSAINKVPRSSRMPFRFTINPYRGCTHACSFCLWGDTRILMADGRTKPLAELEVGEAIYGTVRSGTYRRYTITHVLAHWRTHKPAYRVTLEDGTEIVASGDHRFLTERGWKHVTGAEQGALRRPHLTINNKLMGTGKSGEVPRNSPSYELGYLCGLIRGDGHVRSSSHVRRNRTHRVRTQIHQFRLALADREALDRGREYLACAGVATREFLFQRADEDGPRRPLMAIAVSSRDSVARVRQLIDWPRSPDDDWCKGFLAGIFDAEGSYSRGILRVSNTDRAIIWWIAWCMRRLGFSYVVEDRQLPNGLESVRLRDGLPEALRFFHSVDPAISRKRSIAGTAIKTNARLGVAAIEPLRERPRLFDITTGTGDFIANGVVSHNCFARPSHTYLDFNAREDFERKIVVKVNAPELVRAELGRPSWKREHVALGTNTDPYQWVEGRYRLMPGIWEAMRDFANPCSVLTKSPLLLRDIELFKELVERTEFSANLSVPTLDERPWRETEPHTPHPRKRLEAVGELNRAGIPTGILIAPLMPGINDSPEQVERILELAGEAGARSIGGIGLHLRGEVREIWFDWLRQYRPDLIPYYEELYARGAYLPSEERNRLAALARGPERPSRFKRDGIARDPAPRPRRGSMVGHPAKPDTPAQETLF